MTGRRVREWGGGGWGGERGWFSRSVEEKLQANDVHVILTGEN